VGPEERDDVVRLGVAAEHRLREDELVADVDVEDTARAGDDLDGADGVFKLFENSRRQTGGVRQRPSGDAIFDANLRRVGHEPMLPQVFRVAPSGVLVAEGLVESVRVGSSVGRVEDHDSAAAPTGFLLERFHQELADCTAAKASSDDERGDLATWRVAFDEVLHV
jgi:hypothetical protein